jgi:hypothetical protein
MIARTNFMFLAAATVIISPWPSFCAQAQASPTDLPPEVIGFVSRRAACEEWSNKTSDPASTVQVSGIMESLKCSDIPNHEQALREQYASNPSIVAALDATWVKVVKRVPVEIAPGTLPSDLNH